MTGRFALVTRQPFLFPDDGAGGGGGDGTNPGGTGGGTGDNAGGVKFDAAQQETINRLIAAERREAERKVEERLRKEAEDAEAKRKADAEAEEAKKRGAFEEVERKLTADLETARGEVKTLRDRNQSLEEAMKAGVEAGWKDLPERLQKLYKGPEDDVLARYKHLNDPDILDLAKELAGEKKETPRGAGGDPPRGGGTGDPKADEEARRLNAVRYS